MASTHIRRHLDIQNMETDRQRDAARAASEELHALALRREAHRRAQEDRR